MEQTSSVISTGPEMESIALFNYHKNLLNLSQDILEQVTADKRDVSGMTLGIAKEKLPEEASVMDTLGWIYYKKGFYGNAVQELSDSLEKLPENATVNYHLGAALFQQGNKEKAKPLLEKALEMDADFDGADDARQMLGEI